MSNTDLRKAAVLAVLMLAGCYNDMRDQPRLEPLERAAFSGFQNQALAGHLVPGTVPRGHLQLDTPEYTGRTAEGLVQEIPVEVTAELVARGRNRYDIHCSMCHDRAGYGDGIVVQSGFPRPPSFHIDRLREVEAGHIYRVISGGFGRMPRYGDSVRPHDRWAIVAYIHALQLSQNAEAADLPPELRAELETQSP